MERKDYTDGRHAAKRTAEFWARIDQSGGPDSCWRWTGTIFEGTGYGAFSVRHQNAGTHRLAWEKTNGAIPDGLSVLHRCDVRACCNPKHLFLGTQADNIDDMVQKDRGARGERHPMRKITEADVREIRRLCSTRIEPQEDIALRFGITKNHVSRIATRGVWRRVL